MSNDFAPGRRSRKGRPQMTPEQQALTDELARRATEMWAASDGELSIAEAVELAAFRMGAEMPQTGTEPESDPRPGVPTPPNDRQETA